jgi:hypothetical protein
MLILFENSLKYKNSIIFEYHYKLQLYKIKFIQIMNIDTEDLETFLI